MIVERKNFVQGIQQYVDDQNKGIKAKGTLLSFELSEKARTDIECRILKGKRVERKFSFNPFEIRATGPKACRRQGYEAAQG